MNFTKCFKATVWGLASLGLLLGNHVAIAAGPGEAAAPVTSSPKVVDVALATGGVLTGRVVDARGLPQAGVAVSIATEHRVIAAAQSDDLGVFKVEGLAGGTYRVIVKDGVSMSRLWAANTAPPSARPSLLLVSGEGVLAAQCAPLKVWLADPLIMAGIVAVAVAVPLAVAGSRDSGS